MSMGEPQRGRLHASVPLPENPALYVVRRPEYAYGSSHTVFHLQLALAKFREHTPYRGPLIVSDLSKSGGGRLRPHRSHQSGRDVDIWLPLRANKRGVTIRGGSVEAFNPGDFEHFCSTRPGHIDWDASWQLVKALVRTGQVEGIFLSKSRQRFLRRAALRDGLRGDALDAIIQLRQRTLDAVVRHARGHDKHIHVRFRCADYEASCH
jgi:murein endopeptidase